MMMMRALGGWVLVVCVAAVAAAQTPTFPAARVREILEATRQECPAAWSLAHREGDARRWDFIIHAVRRIQAETPDVGGNWRRGRVGDLSMDGVTFKATNGRYYFADVIAGAGGPNPSITWNVTGEAPEVGFVDASELPAAVEPCGEEKAETPPADAVAEVLRRIDSLKLDIAILSSQVAEAIQRAEAARGAAVDAYNLVADTRHRVEEIYAKTLVVEEMLANPVPYRGGLFGIPIVLRPEARQ